MSVNRIVDRQPLEEDSSLPDRSSFARNPFYSIMKEFQEAIKKLEEARRLDPYNEQIRENLDRVENIARQLPSNLFQGGF